MKESEDIWITVLQFLAFLPGQHQAQESYMVSPRDGRMERTEMSIWHTVGPQEIIDQLRHDGFSCFLQPHPDFPSWTRGRDPNTQPRAWHTVGAQ